MSSAISTYQLVPLANGSHTVRSCADQETFHPVAGPVAEAEALYVAQLQLRARAEEKAPEPFIVWDVGLGAGGNALTALRHLMSSRANIRVISFDRTLDALRFALAHSEALQFPRGFEAEIRALLARRSSIVRHHDFQANWDVLVGDFPARAAAAALNGDLPPPHVIFHDAFSPARNPEMWTLPLFENLFRCLAPQRPCSLATFSRSTLVRVTMLLAGFFVGAGQPVAGKEETTIAANTLKLIAKPLDRRWLKRARISQSAEPLREPIYRRAPLLPSTWERLRQHPQFA